MSRPPLAEVLAGFRPVLPGDEPTLYTAASVYHQSHPTPRFFWSPTYLAARPGVFTWGIVDGCLCVLKSTQVMGNAAMYLVVPPVHPAGDRVREREVIDLLASYCVSTMLSKHDRERYRLLKSEAPPGPWPEYSYAAATHHPPEGGRHKNTRYALNLLDGRDPDLQVHVLQPDALADPEPLKDLARLWHQQKSLHRGEVRLVQTFFEHAAASATPRRAVVITQHGRPIAHSLTEEVAPGYVVIVSRIRDYSEGTSHPDPILALHALDCRLWPNARLCSGSADGTLAAHKEKLRPTDVLSVGRLRTPVRLTFDAYKEARPCPGGVTVPA